MAGTGLPSPSRGQTATPLVDMSGGAGAPERALAAAWRGAGQAAEQLGSLIEPAYRQQVRREAERDVAAGRFSERFVLTNADADYNQVVREGTLARESTAVDTELRALALRHQDDPAAFQSHADNLRSALVERAPDTLAVQLAQNFDARRVPLGERISSEHLQRTARRADADMVARISQLDDEADALVYADGRADSPRVMALLDEQRRLRNVRAQNRATDYTPAQAEVDDSRTTLRLFGTTVTRSATEVFRGNGGGLPGRVQARRFLERSLLGVDTPAPPVRPESTAAAPRTGATVEQLWSALENQESGGRQFGRDGRPLRSSAGAVGVAQLMPGTAALIARQMGDPSLATRYLTDPDANRRMGQFYLQQQLDAFGGEGVLALAAYNAGPGRLTGYTDRRGRRQPGWLETIGDPRTGEITPAAFAARIPITETRDYVRRISARAGASTDATEASAPVAAETAAPAFIAPDLPLPPGVTREAAMRTFRAAMSEVDALYASDRDERTEADRDEREARDLQRERSGELALAVALGETDGSSVQAAHQAGEISDRQAASLTNGLRAAQERQREEANRVALDERRERSDIYRDFSDRAVAGSLNDQEIADGLNGSLLTPGQAQTLRGLRDRTLRPQIDAILAPIRDEANRPGRSRRGNAVIMERAEQTAMELLRRYPDATFAEREQTGRQLAASLFRRPAAANPREATTGRATALRALEAERERLRTSGRPMSAAEYRRRRQEAMHD